MAKYREKQVVIEAEQWNGGTPLPKGCSHGSAEECDTTCCFIDTPKGKMPVHPGDWVITSAKGDRRPCKNWIFMAAYELVEAKSSA